MMHFDWQSWIPHHVTGQDFAVIGFLVFLEGILSVDNAIVLALLAKDLPPRLQKRALTYGMAGAFIFRFIALSLASVLLKLTWVKYVGGAYLLYVGASGLLKKDEMKNAETKNSANFSFWKAVVVIELTDIAFAIDSILAAIALSSKLWVVFCGGIFGIILMRFAATQFIKLLKRFPKLEITAYLMVLLIGVKIILEALAFRQIDFHSVQAPAFWIFWGLMLASILFGFYDRPKRLH